MTYDKWNHGWIPLIAPTITVKGNNLMKEIPNPDYQQCP